jgi:hypothetical protein
MGKFMGMLLSSAVLARADTKFSNLVARLLRQ